MPQTNEYCIVITTCASQEDAEAIVRPLLDERIAACIQVIPIKSYYTWKGAISEDNELLLLIKAKSSLYKEIESSIRKSHKYEVPEIIQVPISGGVESYLNWIREVSRPE